MDGKKMAVFGMFLHPVKMDAVMEYSVVFLQHALLQTT